MDSDEEPMLSTGQAAGMAGIDAVTLRRWCRRYRIPHILLPSGRRRFPMRSFVRWLRENFEMTGEAFQ